MRASPFARPDDVEVVDSICRRILYDNGAFSFWQQAARAGHEWDGVNRDWRPYYRWLERRLFAGRLAIVPDIPGAPSQLSDPLLSQWPFGRTLGVPVWHMNGPLERLGRLCEQFDTVALGWIGHPKLEPVGCPAYRERMAEVDRFFGARWHPTHMLRGIAVAFDYPFVSADSTSLAQNGWRYDSPIEKALGDPWRGRRAYADALERPHARSLHEGCAGDHSASPRRRRAPRPRPSGDNAPDQPWLWRGDGAVS